VDRHRLDADPDPNFLFDADPDQDRHQMRIHMRILPIYRVGKQGEKIK
jgi:hypothetical protein